MANKEFNVSETVADTFFRSLHNARVRVESLDMQIKQGYDDLEKLQERRLKVAAEVTDITQFLDEVVPDVWRDKYVEWRQRERPAG